MKQMSLEERELFRMAILRVLQASDTRFGCSPKAVSHLVAAFGFPEAEEAAVLEEIEYLEGKGLCSQVKKTISRENRVWRISAEGVALLDR